MWPTQPSDSAGATMLTRWLYILFALGLLMVNIGIFHSDALVLLGLAFMVTPLTLGIIASIERNYR